MRFGSLFSGIGGFDLGFERAGMTCSWQCEIDAACRGVLGAHFGAEIIEDVCNVRSDNVSAVDLVCGGFPCQDLSIAGKRAGLAGERSGLWFEFHRVLDDLRPQWVVIENVPGLLSSNGGRDFATILRGMVELGYGVCWRILDAQYFGVAQRRRRVFIVGHLGDGRAAEILFESAGMYGDTPARGTPGQGVTPAVANGINGSDRRGRQPGSAASMIAAPLVGHHRRDDLDNETYVIKPQTFAIGGFGDYKEAIGTQRANGGDSGGGSEMLTVTYNIQHNDGGEHRRKDRPEGGLYVNETDVALTVGTTDATIVAHTLNHHHGRTDGESETFIVIAPTLRGMPNQGPGRMVDDVQIISTSGVRRLMPVECERLQGFPDGWTAVNGQKDSPRYRQLGNAVAVPVIEWIGRRIMAANNA